MSVRINHERLNRQVHGPIGAYEPPSIAGRGWRGGRPMSASLARLFAVDAKMYMRTDPMRVEGSQRLGLGRKWECRKCRARFYDLGRKEPVCPACAK